MALKDYTVEDPSPEKPVLVSKNSEESEQAVVKAPDHNKGANGESSEEDKNDEEFEEKQLNLTKVDKDRPRCEICNKRMEESDEEEVEYECPDNCDKVLDKEEPENKEDKETDEKGREILYQA